MEERIIDDEYGRGVRLKKTKDGYVDVTDELANDTKDTEDMEDAEEIAFAFPMMNVDEDDEDLVGLSPEEAAALIKQKEEEAAKRKAEYQRVCKEGDELLATGSFKTAELKFEKALLLDDEATEASVGYWRAKTENFANPDVLMEEYVDAGIENLEYDLGYAAVEKIREQYQDVFRLRYNALCEEEAPLADKVESKQARRREILSSRLKKSGIAFGICSVLGLALLTLTIVFGLQIPTTRENVHLIPTIICGAAFFVALIAFVIATNKFLNDLRMHAANEKLSSTEDGQRLEEIREYKELYACFLLPNQQDNAEKTE